MQTSYMDAPSFEELIALFYSQLSSGCESFDCKNENCASCSSFIHRWTEDDDIDMAALSLVDEYASTPSLLCVNTLPRVITTPHIIPMATRFRKFANDLIRGVDTTCYDIFAVPLAFCYFGVTGDGCFAGDDLQMDPTFYADLSRAITDNAQLFQPFQKSFEGTVAFLTRERIETLFELRGVLTALLFMPIFTNTDSAFKELNPLLLAIGVLRGPALAAFVSALKRCPVLIRVGNECVQRSLTFLLSKNIPQHHSVVHIFAGIIEILATANDATENPLPYETFVSESLAAHIIPEGEFAMAANNIVSFLDSPSVLTSDMKFHILNGESKARGHTELVVRRDHIIADFISKVQSQKDFARRLVISFKGEVAKDEGGVSREFFFLAANKLFESGHGFTKCNSETFHWFQSNGEFNAQRDISFMWAAGALVRLAMTNGVIIPVRFPLAVYRKLKGEKLTLNDYAELYPEQALSLKCMKAAFQAGSDPDYEVFFSVTEARKGGYADIPLIANGCDVKVCCDNVDQYCDAIIKYYLETSVSKSFAAFREKFLMTGQSVVMSKLSCNDYSVLISGTEVFDWTKLRETAEYVGYDAASPAVAAFWNVLESLSEDHRRKMLQFMTGSPRAPVGGLGSIRLKVHKTKADRLPSARTCAYILFLPDVAAPEMMHRHLLTCIENCEGFGLI